MTTVFLSHSSRDDNLVKPLTEWLNHNGITDIFVDHSKIRVGDRWTDALRNAKAACRVVLCLITPSWLQSDECYAEYLAGWYAGKRIMPLLAMSGATPDDRQKARLSRILGEDQGFDLSLVGAPLELDFDAQPEQAAILIAGLRAGGALTRIGLDPLAFEVDTLRRPDPFPGLESFGDDDADAAIFFGRSPEIAACIEDLREMRATGDRRVYAILGASGSGKSSLMKAGVLPRLRRERGWLVFRAFRPGADPLYSFAEAIARTAADMQINWAPGSIYEELLTAWRAARRQDVQGNSSLSDTSSDRNTQTSTAFDATLLTAVESRIRHLREREDKQAATCLVAIDQADELVQNQDESGAALSDFIAALSSMAAPGEVIMPYVLVFTIRDDSFSELRSSEKFARVRIRTADIRALPLYRFAHAIEQPADRYGVIMEPTLVQAMMEDAPETDALPLLAFALRRLWIRFALERRIRQANYKLFGELPGLIEDAAERALRGMDPRDDSPLTPTRVSAERERRVRLAFLPSLAQFNERGRAIRRLASTDTFSEEEMELLAPFNRWRLLTTRGNMIEVSHEAMFREWPRFVEWLKPERERLEALRGVEAAAQTWDSQGRKEEYLGHRKQRLRVAESLMTIPSYEKQMEANGLVKGYLLRCRRAERRRMILTTVASLCLAVIAGGLIATNMKSLSAFVETAENVQAGLPGASVATNQIWTQMSIRRSLLNTVLQRYLEYALADINPNSDGTSKDPLRDAAIVLLQTRAGTTGSDPWSIGQIAASLLKGTTTQRDQLRAYFDATFKPECACWSPVDGDQHLAATAWIVLGQANQRVQTRTDILNAILDRQFDDGGWPIFLQAARTKASNSTYATALLLLALHEFLAVGDTDPALTTRIREAIAKARIWLHSRAPTDGKPWLDYPDSAGRTVPSRGNSAFVVYVLLTTGGQPEDQRLFNEWFEKLGAPTTLDQMDTSDQFVRLADGNVRRDGTRYLTLGWELAAIGRGARYLGGLERIKARRFFFEALGNWPSDQAGRFDFSAAETLYAVNTLFAREGLLDVKGN